MPEGGWSLEGLVEDLMKSGAKGAAVVTRDGLPVVEDLPASSFADSVCAMAAASLAAAESAFSGSRCGAVRRTWIEGPNRLALIQGLDARLLLVVFLTVDADRDAVKDRISAAVEGLRVAAG